MKQSDILYKKAHEAVALQSSKVPARSIYVVDIPGFAARWNCYSDDERQDVFYDFDPDEHRPHKGKPHWKVGTPDLAADPLSSAVGPLVQFPYEKLFRSGQ